jgi:glycosyltransferase involved in cell wall biosynthesis
MKSKIAPHIVWLYEKSHWKHPFIRLQLDYLAEAGYPVTLINMLNVTLKDTRYRHVSIPEKTGNRFLNHFLHKQYGAYRFGLSLPTVMLLHAIRHKPDIVIASLPMALWVGSMVKRLNGARLVYYPFELYGEQISRFSHTLAWIEKRMLRKRIDSMITQNSQRANVYVEERGCRVPPSIVHNYKSRRNVQKSGELREYVGLSAETRIVLYEGRLSPSRWLDRLVQSSAYLPDNVKLVMIGTIDDKDGWWDKTMAPLMKRPEIAAKTVIGSWVSPDKIMDYVADADVGVIIYDDKTRNNYFCEPGKLSDYAIAGVPVVAPAFPSIGPVILEYGIGATFERAEPVEIAEAIKKVLGVPKHHFRSRLERAKSEFIWETQAPNFLRAVLGHD